MTGDAGEVHLRPKVMDLLQLLAERAGEVVSHEEIVARVWGKEFIAESALPGIVSELRAAFGDDPVAPRVLETIPKRGYRLVAPVGPLDSDDTVAEICPRRAARRAARCGVAVLLAVVAVLTVVGAWYWASTRRPLPVQPATRLAVLPFESYGEVAEQYFSAGLVDELTDRLAQDGRVVVVARDARAPATLETSGVVEIGRQLGVEYVLTGSIRWDAAAGAATRVRITPQLVRVADATLVYSDTLDFPLEDVFGVHREVAAQVMAGLAGTFSAASQRPEPGPTPVPEAYRLYLRAVEHGARFDSPEAQFLCQSLLERVTEIDPAFAPGWARLALLHARINHLGYDRSASRRAAAGAAMERALALAPEDPAVRTAHAGYLYFAAEDYDGALAVLNEAERFLPQRAEYAELRGYLLRRTGRWEEGLAALQEARRRSPTTAWYACETGMTRMAMGRYEEADEDFAQAIAMAPDLQAAYEWKAHNTLLRTRSPAAARRDLERMPAASRVSPALEAWFIAICEGRYDEALRVVEALPAAGAAHRWHFVPRSLLEAQVHLLTGDTGAAERAFAEAREALQYRLADSPEDARAHASLGLALAGLGLAEEAVLAGERAVALCPVQKDAVRGGFYLEALARVHVLNRDLDAAVRVLERLLAQPIFPQALPLFDLDPRWAALRAHPRFEALLTLARTPATQRADAGG